MGKKKEREFEEPSSIPNDEDEATLAAIEEGIGDAKAGTISIKRVRQPLPRRIAPFSYKDR
jgi:hypothetical protein